MTHRTGRHFLHIPGPSPVPERVLRAMDRQVIDHRGPDFGVLGREVLEGCRTIFRTKGPVVIYPGSGTGAWEAAIVNTLSSGDRVLMFETGHFATLWRQMAARWGIEVEFVPGDWRHGVDPALVEAKLAEDRSHSFKAVMVVHNETSTGVTSRIPAIRKAIDAAGHPALLLVDTISSLGSVDVRHDEWGVDVTVSGSQKGLMLPPGLGFTAISEKARAAGKSNNLPRSYWDWEEMLKPNANGYFPYTPATNLLYGLREAVAILLEEGLDNVFARHQRLAAATRAAVEAWGLEVLCLNPDEHSPVLTAVMMPDGKGADAFRALVLEKFDMSLGAGLSKLADKIFRIGHLGETNDLTLMGALSGVEMGLAAAGVPHRPGGVLAAMASLRSGLDG
ncbi:MULTISPECIES: pyridoxal-phosphate-dependent aminotransferase family protein [Methylorubrum]|jgi:alanine-glyoxylate transaminase/serine-glyoxylate transaminase/serine-pyruvate transaminase|uniref:Serine--glyoxylate aminotransferase n=2 Tax=Methylorubrum extorquens TaxID=408 RepID=C5AQU8_METEA|nr:MULTISPECIES: aminotransferase class V-fold PLP-dependent enzyme [Methylorubrum]KQP95719.1 serine--glyoxylate aminotransferase [Methylobacterium sp. Leaf119]MBA9068914.1 alanine-glyoxylate transaminase/serine-glyoxylate transaminase/serine-pyruvate transaminase [Methylobacterium sp. RAS18]ABY32569.1 aminotransferase class V [Methylorubrum extorquens PA1]ACS42221.1 serine-glyoxylate aminotransferase [Methylorubrum extorquens AM1]EHP91787.1 Serine--glyoxylate transaminase [Methylorubrum extor